VRLRALPMAPHPRRCVAAERDHFLSLGARRLDDAFHQPPGNALSAQGARRLDMENQDAVIGTAVIRKRDLPRKVQLEAALVGIVGKAAVHGELPSDRGENSRRAVAVPRSLVLGAAVFIPPHEPKTPHDEEQHRKKRDDRDDFVAVEFHFAYCFFGRGGSLGATGAVKNSSIAESTVQ